VRGGTGPAVDLVIVEALLEQEGDLEPPKLPAPLHRNQPGQPPPALPQRVLDRQVLEGDGGIRNREHSGIGLRADVEYGGGGQREYASNRGMGVRVEPERAADEA